MCTFIILSALLTAGVKRVETFRLSLNFRESPGQMKLIESVHHQSPPVTDGLSVRAVR